MRDTFPPYKMAIEGHLFQVNAGYLLDHYFLYQYDLWMATYAAPSSYLTSQDFWDHFGVSFPQAIADRTYLYGIVVSSCRDMHNKVVVMRAQDKDGIRAWANILIDF